MGIFKRKISGNNYVDDVPARSAGRRSTFRTLSTTELLSNATVASCVSLMADSVALLSCNVYKKTAHGRERDDRPSLAYCLHVAPNYYDTPFTFWQTVMFHLCLKGNAFIFIQRNNDYSVRALIPIDPDRTEICFDLNNEIYYVYTDSNGRTYKYTTDNILHIPAYRYNTIRGLSPMEYANHAASLGNTLDEYTVDSFDGGLQTKLIVEVPVEERNFTKEDAQKLTDRIMAANGGKENRDKPLILAHGHKGIPLNMSNNKDAQLAENRNFTEKEIAKIFRIPLYMLGKDDSKFTNQEQANTFFLQHTLTPWLVRIQQHLNRLLTYPFRDDHYVEFDTDTMLRADYATRWNAHRENFKSGLFTLNQILDMENLPRVKEAYGDEHFGLENYKPLSQAMKTESE